MFPCIVFLHLVIVELFRSKIGSSGSGFYFNEVFYWIFFIYFLTNKNTFIDYNLKILLVIYVIFLFLIFIGYLKDPLPPMEVFKYSRVLNAHVVIFSTVCYCRIYGSKKLLEFLFWGFIIFNFRNIYGAYVLKEKIMLHSAVLGMASSYIILYSFLKLNLKELGIRRPLLLFLILLNAALPFLGMVRGGILAVGIAFMLVPFYFTYFNVRDMLVTFPVIITLGIISFSVFISLYPDSIFHHHHGSSNLSELLDDTKDINTIDLRILRWSILFDAFVDNPLIGVGFWERILADVHGPDEVWGAHNYFISILAGGGLLLSIPILLIHVLPLIKSMNIVWNKIPVDGYFFVGIGCFLNVININMTNPFFGTRGIEVIIWTMFGVGIYEIYHKYYQYLFKRQENSKKIQMAN